MVYTTPCSKCDHRKVCGIKDKYNECIRILSDGLGSDEMLSCTGTIFVCPHSTSVQHNEAILAYKRALQ